MSKNKAVDPAGDRIAAFVQQFNAELAAGGSDLRMEYPWLFRVGPGTDPFARLRTGVRWTRASVEYVLDESDYTADVATADLESALMSAFDSWNDIGRTVLQTSRGADDVGENPDFLDGTFGVAGGELVCVTPIDVTSPTFGGFTPGGGILFSPPTDILVGGWLAAPYFELCLGVEGILAVTWFLSGPDQNGDGYRDLAYVEQFFNEGFDWATTGSVFLDPNAPTDLETVAVHENGHALGLGHFGGPVRNQPLILKPNGRVFNPEAVMNPGYLGGEKRTPLAPDEAGLTTLYTGHVTTTE